MATSSKNKSASIGASQKDGIVQLQTVEGLGQILDALPCELAIIDHAGTILFVNQSWTLFAQTEGATDADKVLVGANYLSVSDADPDASDIAHGIRAVLNGEIPHFWAEYPCHSDVEERWFLIEVKAISAPVQGAVISHTRLPRQPYADWGNLDTLNSGTSTSISGTMVGVVPLSEALPDTHARFVFEYGKLLDEALQHACLRNNTTFNNRVKLFGQDLALARCTPRDAMAVHIEAVKSKMVSRPNRRAGYVEEARYLLIEMLGAMASFYRTQSVGVREGNKTPPKAARKRGLS